eukprot:scaffold1574_cov119-Isochrysis_galbana.AAC.2
MDRYNISTLCDPATRGPAPPPPTPPASASTGSQAERRRLSAAECSRSFAMEPATRLILRRSQFMLRRPARAPGSTGEASRAWAEAGCWCTARER